jgi:N-acetylneuraminic acid mutarotase
VALDLTRKPGRLAALILALLLLPFAGRPALAADTDTWQPVAAMTTPRIGGLTATPLSNGLVLVAGGIVENRGAADPRELYGPTATAELYDPASGAWRATGSMATPRAFHTASLLRDGTVLVLGGGAEMGGHTGLRSAEIYDPATGSWRPAPHLREARWFHTATTLPDGRVLVAGGGTDSAERYDPATASWQQAGTMSRPRAMHAATLLHDGTVLALGGRASETSARGTDPATAERYDPATNSWRPAGTLPAAFTGGFSATTLLDGTVLVAGGAGLGAAIYDPATAIWRPIARMNVRRIGQSATLLADGTVLMVGGETMSAERYLPASGTWHLEPSTRGYHEAHAAALLPDGSVFVAGAFGPEVERFIPGATPTPLPPAHPPSGAWQPAGAMTTPRWGHSATLLRDGTVLVAGGCAAQPCGDALSSAELYDPGTGAWRATGAMAVARSSHAATLLADGAVLVVVGQHPEASGNAERYDPAAGVWRPVAAPPVSLMRTAAATLWDGTVLVAGHTADYRFAALRYDPATDSWRQAAARSAEGDRPETAANDWIALVPLPGDTVLLASAYASAVYDPSADRWTELATGGAPSFFRGAPLPGGALFVGEGGASRYDRADGAWSETAGPAAARYFHAVAPLASGAVLLSGGYGASDERGDPISPVLASAELYDAATATWQDTGPLATARAYHVATALADGSVLVTGGVGTGGVLAAAERYVLSTPAQPTASPAGASAPPAVGTGTRDRRAAGIAVAFLVVGVCALIGLPVALRWGEKHRRTHPSNRGTGV